MKEKIAIIGLGYVGLPLAIEFSKKYKTIGFDINNLRIKELLVGNDSTLEVCSKEIKKQTIKENSINSSKGILFRTVSWKVWRSGYNSKNGNTYSSICC